ncbi:MAG: NAD(P)H-dependent oxidoreductase [Spirochaetales bacterium]|nr:NAD(P)H-dependent oxidoreductase [Spirochaetales bacterium]
MNAIVVLAHPNQKSLNAALAQTAVEALKINPKIQHIDFLDLYHEQFPPALVFGGKKRRRDMVSDPDFESYRQRISQAQFLIFVYPIWWGRPPAILLGFIDQVFARGFAYTFQGKLPQGLLKGKQAWCVSTMHSPTIYPPLFLRNAHKMMMKRATLGFCGIRPVHFLSFGSMEEKSSRQGKALARVRKVLSKI